MVCQAMGGRWTRYGIHVSCLAFLLLVLEVQECSSLNAEGSALLRFRDKVESDPFGALADWNPFDCEPCKWSGVDCLDGKVHVLNLSGLNLEGNLVPELGKLTNLRFLDLSKNHLSGTIPPQFGRLTALEVLDLSSNNLSGTIPSELGDLSSLKYLLLCDNKFERNIPEEIRKLHLLIDLMFDEILTASAAEISCANRKFGRRFKFGNEASQSHADNGCTNLVDSPEQDAFQHVEEHTNIVRRILVELSSSNLEVVPRKVGVPPPSEPVLPSRSSGSFSAVPGKKISPNPVTEEHRPNNVTITGGSSQPSESSDGESGISLRLIIGILVAVFLLVVALVLFFVFKSRAAQTIGPWKSGLSGQLQKAFVTGVPKLNRGELEAACEDFSNIVRTCDGVLTIYKGTLSSGVEIAVVSTAISSLKDWSKRAELTFRKKIDSLSRVNHKNFVNLIGYCEEDEPFTRMMVLEYAPNGTLSEHLHVEEVEHLDWNARMRIIMGTAYCFQYMHDLNPPVPHFNLTSKEIYLTDDYAAKIADVNFWTELIAKSKQKESESEHSELPPLADVETNIYSFGILLLEVVSGKHTYSDEDGNLLNWAAQFLNDKRTIRNLVDPSLKSFKDNELDKVCEVIQDCTQQDARKRPRMKEVIQKLRQALDISADAATPRLSPLWWAELEILSQEAA